MVEQSSQRNPRKSPPVSRPVLERVFRVHSEQAARVIRQSYPRLIRSLYAIDVILRIIGKEAAVDELETAVSRMITDCAGELVAERARLMKLKEINGILDSPVYSQAREFTAKIASPQVAQFVELIRLLDHVMQEMDTLWLCQVISSKQCSEARFRWQQRLNRLANRIITLERQMHRAVYQPSLPVESLNLEDLALLPVVADEKVGDLGVSPEQDTDFVEE